MPLLSARLASAFLMLVYGKLRKYKMPQIDFSTYTMQILYLLFFFFLTYLVVSRLFINKIEAVLSMRQNKTDNLLSEAEVMIIAARKLMLEAQEIVKDARIESIGTKKTARENAKHFLSVEMAGIRKTSEKELLKQLEKLKRIEQKMLAQIPKLSEQIGSELANLSLRYFDSMIRD